MWQLGNFDKSLQDRNLYLRWRWGDCCFTSNPTEGPTSCTVVINRVLVEKNPPSLLVIHDVRSSIVVRLLIHFSVYVCQYCFHALGSSLPKIYLTSAGPPWELFFKWAITMSIWFCVYKSLEITMIKIHFAVYRLFVLDACLCWNKWKITVDKLRCMWTELLSKECKTTCYVIVTWHVHIWNSRLL